MPKLAVLNVVGLTPRLLPQAPFLRSWAQRGKTAAVTPILPAVTCSMQSTLLTGVLPSEHGIVGNGWYVRDEGDIRFWRQSNRLVQHEKIWEKARRLGIPDFTCANMFWWYNMYSSVDYAATPRPMYPADGRKIPDTWTEPAGLRAELRQKLGSFPLFEFWGPGTTIRSSEWIARASLHVDARYDPGMTLIYLPHLDYVLQREGPEGASVAGEVARIDGICEELITHYESHGTAVLVLSEYGITPVRRSVPLNRILRREGFLRVREELGRELLDAGASQAFAVADHQVAHVYVNDRDVLEDVRALVAATNGVASVLYGETRAAHGLDHPRAGDLVAVADRDAWFTYYYWLDDDRAPDFARTVDIHRKPGYDPCELFLDPALLSARLRAGFRLLQKKLGFRYLLDVIPLDPSLVKGSHGRRPDDPTDGPLILSNRPDLLSTSPLPATDIQDIMLAHLLEGCSD
ncbi:MAG: alkaline phosphatase family protein [Bacteroidetes bacterium SB0662_bin_6]|nr:alkaline phosphatase family protein [Bacteroidetes bacterium SB0668_bin_1]MYE04078.1 alkaline phosphatase family protein [Bacteroidetes bacterium SB0662_bin_6]